MKNSTQIQNRVLETLYSAELSGGAFRIVLLIIRKTNGWKKEDDWISFSQFEEITGLSRHTVNKELQRLQKANILLVSKCLPKRYKINPDVDSWVVSKSLLVSKCLQDGKQMRTQSVSKCVHTKETITKETNTKEIISKDIRKKPNPEVTDLMDYLSNSLGNSLDGTVKDNRQYCWNLLRKMKKDYPDKNAVEAIKVLIDVGLKSDFHSKNLTNFKYLYYNTQKIIKDYQNNKSSLIVIS